MTRRSYRPGRRRHSSSPLDNFLPPYLRTGKHSRGRDKDKDLDDGGVPVDPNKPSTLSGGAAAELEFDD